MKRRFFVVVESIGVYTFRWPLIDTDGRVRLFSTMSEASTAGREHSPVPGASHKCYIRDISVPENITALGFDDFVRFSITENNGDFDNTDLVLLNVRPVYSASTDGELPSRKAVVQSPAKRRIRIRRETDKG